MAEYVKELYSWIAFVPNMTFKKFSGKSELLPL